MWQGRLIAVRACAIGSGLQAASPPRRTTQALLGCRALPAGCRAQAREGCADGPVLFSLPGIRGLADARLVFHQAVTFIVGENGSGKSTPLEAIVVARGFNAEGGTRISTSARSPRIRPRTTFRAWGAAAGEPGAVSSCAPRASTTSPATSTRWVGEPADRSARLAASTPVRPSITRNPRVPREPRAPVALSARQRRGVLIPLRDPRRPPAPARPRATPAAPGTAR
ncbi:AAA family ATPase [Pseudoxanthomonas sp. X-1]|nr:AAA family ATPase [Pseudoxanthomonas sp. X-1]